jgi:DNA ligase-1
LACIHDGLQLLDVIEVTSSTNECVDILKKIKDEYPEVVELIRYALDYRYKFFIKKFKFTPVSGAVHNKFNEFKELAEFLNTNRSRSDETVAKVEEFLNSCDEIQARWYSRVLLKDLRNGVGRTISNKAGLDIPVFDVQLAKDGKRCKKLKNIIEDGCYLSPKFDGYRCLAVVHNYQCTLYSRNGTEFENFPAIQDEIERFAKLYDRPDFVLDGEIMSDDFNSMQQSAFASKRGTTVGDMKYYVFDYVSYVEWNTENFRNPCVLRYRQLDNLFLSYGNWHEGKYLIKVPHTQCNNYDDAMQFEKDCLAKGFEGAMINPNIPYYKGKKSNKMLKLKTFETEDVVVVDVYEGEGKYVGMMGGMLVLQPNGEHCDVGSGFTDKDRQEMWDNPDSVRNRIIECAFQEYTPDNKMRFPVFKRFRDNGSNKGKR